MTDHASLKPDKSSQAQYACDNCKDRKLSCSRERSGCQRCKVERNTCIYSRHGIIRRHKKRKRELVDTLPSSHATSHLISDPSFGEDLTLQSHLASDIEVTREHLNRLDASRKNPLGALSLLSDACAAVWHDGAKINRADGRFFLFEDRAAAWAKVFTTTLDRGRPLFTRPPADVVQLLEGSRPSEVRDKAWLVIYYGIVLSMVSSTAPNDEDTKSKLRCNLWLSLNDPRLFLEPRESNIQALTLLASHVEEFTTPSLCWMLVTNACRMLQALGVNQRRLDAEAKQRRILMFWHLNLVDSGLALIFGRTPTFHRAMVKEMPLPTMAQLLPFQPHVTSDCPGGGGLFGPHYIYQMMLLSRILVEVWHLLYEEAPEGSIQNEAITELSKALEDWYWQAEEVLKAAAFAEKPFRDSKSSASISLGLRMVKYQYLFSHVLLTRSSAAMKAQCISSSKQMLFMLHDLVSDSEEPFNGIVWQMICCPFTPLLILFGEVVSGRDQKPEEHAELIAAMEQMPLFLGRMAVRNSLAAKLECIASVLVQYAKSANSASDPSKRKEALAPGTQVENLPFPWPPTEDMLQWDSFVNGSVVLPETYQSQSLRSVAQPNDVATWASDLFGDAIVDYIGWDSQVWTTPMASE